MNKNFRALLYTDRKLHRDFRKLLDKREGKSVSEWFREEEMKYIAKYGNKKS